KSAAKDSAAKNPKDNGDRDAPVDPATITHPVLWQDPGDIAAKDLYEGAGGAAGRPQPPFTFVSEDMSGTNPKFDAKDASGVTWRVKMGEESRPEVVASRLLWAMGYFVNDDYVLPDTTVQQLQMKRGGKAIGADGRILDARFARKPDHQKKIGIWRWKDNPFNDQREFNELRVMMAVMNNWDLKDINNSVYED